MCPLCVLAVVCAPVVCARYVCPLCAPAVCACCVCLLCVPAVLPSARLVKKMAPGVALVAAARAPGAIYVLFNAGWAAGGGNEKMAPEGPRAGPPEARRRAGEAPGSTQAAPEGARKPLVARGLSAGQQAPGGPALVQTRSHLFAIMFANVIVVESAQEPSICYPQFRLPFTYYAGAIFSLLNAGWEANAVMKRWLLRARRSSTQSSQEPSICHVFVCVTHLKSAQEPSI